MPNSSPPSPEDDTDAALLAVLSDLLAREKSLSAPIQWVTEGRDLRFTATLEINEATDDRVRLHGRASAGMPDRQVSLLLIWIAGPGPARPFERLEWRPLGAHTNRPSVPPPHRHRVITTSHRHALDLNARVDGGLLAAMAQNLPGAEALEPEPSDWTAFVAIAATVWRVVDLVHAPSPPWQYDLLFPSEGAGKRGRDR
jgi:hypothetical protein